MVRFLWIATAVVFASVCLNCSTINIMLPGANGTGVETAQGGTGQDFLAEQKTAVNYYPEADYGPFDISSDHKALDGKIDELKRARLIEYKESQKVKAGAFIVDINIYQAKEVSTDADTSVPFNLK